MMKEDSQASEFQSCFHSLRATERNGSLWREPISEEEVLLVTEQKPLLKGSFYIDIIDSEHLANYVVTEFYFYIYAAKNGKGPRIIDLAFQSFAPFESVRYPGKYFGLKLYYGKTSEQLYFPSSESRDLLADKLREVLIGLDFGTQYAIKNKLGKGASSNVFRLDRLRDRQSFAGKFIKHKKLQEDPRGVAMLMQEINIMRHVQHRNIVKLHEVYEVANGVVLVLDLVEGCELNKIASKLTDRQIEEVFHALIETTAYLQAEGIVHRDLKPNNILIETTQKRGRESVKIIDFGLAAYLETDPIVYKCGTPGYISPELINTKLNKGLTPKFDSFSMGIVFYELIYGFNPFVQKGFKKKEIIQANQKGVVSFEFPPIREVLEHKYKEVVQSLVNLDQEQRPTPAQIAENKVFDFAKDFIKLRRKKTLYEHDTLMEENATNLLQTNSYATKTMKNKFKENEGPGGLMVPKPRRMGKEDSFIHMKNLQVHQTGALGQEHPKDELRLTNYLEPQVILKKGERHINRIVVFSNSNRSMNNPKFKPRSCEEHMVEDTKNQFVLLADVMKGFDMDQSFYQSEDWDNIIEEEEEPSEKLVKATLLGMPE